MPATAAVLPEPFRDLEPYVTQWAVPTMAERHRRRLDSSPAARMAFYEAMVGRLPAVAAYLDTLPLHELPPAATLLLQLALALAEISLTQEIYNPQQEEAHARAARILKIPLEMDEY